MDVKKNRVYHMKNLRDHLEELFTLCGITPKKVTIVENSAIAEFLESIIKDTNLYHYLEALDAQSLQAIEVMKDRNLDEWNNRQNEKRLQELLRKKEYKQEDIEKVQVERDTWKEKYTKEKANWEERCKKAEQDLDAYQLRTEKLETEHRNQIRMLIEMRDTLLMREKWIEDNAPEEIAATKLVRTQLEETARILKNVGVEISEGTGIYDKEVHTVVGTVPAESDDKIGHIAQTVRPGYCLKGEILRVQEVIIYVKGEI